MTEASFSWQALAPAWRFRGRLANSCTLTFAWRPPDSHLALLSPCHRAPFGSSGQCQACGGWCKPAWAEEPRGPAFSFRRGVEALGQGEALSEALLATTLASSEPFAAVLEAQEVSQATVNLLTALAPWQAEREEMLERAKKTAWNVRSERRRQEAQARFRNQQEQALWRRFRRTHGVAPWEAP